MYKWSGFFVRSSLFQILFSQFSKNVKKRKKKKKAIQKSKKLDNINTIIKDSYRTSPLIDEKENDEN